MTRSSVPQFDATAPLIRGINLLEASAGTGKTYNITNLVMRLVAEQDLRVERILVVTFTRAATAELRERVRRRLGEGIDALARAAAEPDWTPSESDDRVMHRFVVDGRASDQLAPWRRRLMLARESFDEASISTIHGFCQKTLQQSAFESDLDFEAELVEDMQPLLEELVDDFMAIELRRRSSEWYRYLRDVAQVTRRDLLSLARVLESNPNALVIPAVEDRGDPEQIWRDCMQAFRATWKRSSREAEKIIVAAYREKRFRTTKPYNTSQPGRRRKALDASLDTLELDFVDRKEDIRVYGLTQILAHLLPGETIEHHEVFVTTQRLIDESAEALKLQFVDFLRRELPRRKAERNILSFDDLLRRLDGSLTQADSEAAEVLRRRIREDFDAALIDEFQDTDPVQWEIFETVFGEDAWLYLVGDPKQAIYAFRGADVYTYLRAKKAAKGRQGTLVVNWRSDERYVRALNALLDIEGVFGEDGIDYVPVEAAERHREDRLRVGEDSRPPLQLKFFSRDLYGRAGSIPRGWRPLPDYVAADVAAFLEMNPEIRDEDGEGWRPVEPRDVAVLVRRNSEARDIQAALSRAEVPAVITGAGSVYESAEATAVQRLLDALLQPSSEGLAKAAWTSVLFGVSGNELAAMDDAAWEAKLECLHEWSVSWREEGFVRTVRRIFSHEHVPERVLERRDGERRMTNLLHSIELVHLAETRERLGPSALAAWLRTKRLDRDSRHEEAELRLESDADAVTIVTVHRSKGLEYPIVFCPTLWDGQLISPGFNEDRHLRFHAGDEQRTLGLDLRLSSSHGPKLEHLMQARRERQAENMRLLYVALTRAKHRCVVYWGAFRGYETSGLARVLHGDRGGPTEGGTWSLGEVEDSQMLEDLETLRSRHPRLIEVLEAEELVHARWTGRSGDRPELAARVFRRDRLDRWWRRASYSSLTRHAEDHRVDEGSPEAEGRDLDVGRDEMGEPNAPAPIEIPHDAPNVPLADFPRGTSAGTFLHAVLEHYDFTEVEDASTLRDMLRVQMAQHGISDVWEKTLEAGLGSALTTPLGGPLGDARLCDVPVCDRLDELEFEFPVAGGYELVDGRDYVRPSALADVFRRLRPPTENLSAAYIEALAALGFGPPVRGFMAGAIDLVFRREVDGHPRWFVADYKSNWLGAADWTRSTPHHYGGRALAQAMEHRHYYLQYHLYTVALHRYLRWRLPDYQYDRDFGGAYYLFLRGMVGPTTPRDGGAPNGVFFDRPDFALIDQLDTLLADPERVDPRGGHG